MKLKHILTAVLLAGFTLGSMADAAAIDDAKAVAKDVTSSLADIGTATQSALNESTTTAGNTPADVLTAVISQRNNWTAEQLYYICRVAILTKNELFDEATIETILRNAGVSKRNIRVVLPMIFTDAAIANGGVIGDEQLSQSQSGAHIGANSGDKYPGIPTPDPMTRDN